MEVNPNSYSNFVFSEQEKAQIRLHIKRNLIAGKDGFNTPETVLIVEKNIIEIIQDWNKEIKKTIVENRNSRSATYVFKKHIHKDNIVLINEIFKNHFPYIESCYTSDVTDSYGLSKAPRLESHVEHALFTWFSKSPDQKVIFSWREDHPLLSAFRLPITNPVTASSIVNQLWQSALEAKGTDLSVRSETRTFHLHSFIVKSRFPSFEYVFFPEFKEQTLETFFKYLYVGHEAIENLNFDELVDLFALRNPELRTTIVQLISNLFPLTENVMPRSLKLLQLGREHLDQKLLSLGLNLASTLDEENFEDLLLNSFNLDQLEFIINNVDASVSEDVRSRVKVCLKVLNLSKRLTSK